MKDSEAVRQAIEFLKDRPMPDVKMGDIPRLHAWWESLHALARRLLEQEKATEAAHDPPSLPPQQEQRLQQQHQQQQQQMQPAPPG